MFMLFERESLQEVRTKQNKVKAVRYNSKTNSLYRRQKNVYSSNL